MTSQHEADRLLSEWQANRHLPPAERLCAANDNKSGDAFVVEQMDRDLALVAAEMDAKADRAFGAIMGFA